MKKAIRLIIGTRLRSARLAAKLTQQHVADHFNCSRQAVSSWESGKTLPDLLEFRELCELYVVSSGSILSAVDDEEETGRALIRRLLDAARPRLQVA